MSGPPRPEHVAYLSFEGGGRAGLVVHPGVARALVDLGVLRYDGDGRQVGVRGFAGSSSGSVVATLLSCGYTGDELCMLLSEPAFDLVFRLEPFALGLQAKPLGATVRRPPAPPAAPTLLQRAAEAAGPQSVPGVAQAVVTLAGATMTALGDPAGALADVAMILQSSFETALTDSTNQDRLRRERLTRRLQAITDEQDLPPWMKALVSGATHELRDAVQAKTAQWGRDQIVAWTDQHYPHVVAKLADALLGPNSRVEQNPDNPFNLVKIDYGLFAGAVWREYLDRLVAFARFRVRYRAMLPDLRVPTDLEFMIAAAVDQVFFDRIAEAATTAVYDPATEDLPDFEGEFEALRNTTFAQHRDDLYPGRSATGPPPLALSAANLSSQESHLFSVATAPWLCVADAMRIATSLPPVFKPFVLDSGDLPGDWPRTLDTFAAAPFMVGYWMDGGVFWNSPADTFRAWETSELLTLGIGIGIGQRVVIEDLTDFFTAMVNLVYERNISATRVDIDRFLILDNFSIGTLAPRMSGPELDFYRGYGYWQTVAFFGNQDAQPQ